MPELKDFLKPKKIPEEKKKDYNQKFKELKDDLESNERIFNVLHDYFSSKKYSPEVISEYYDTYWKWYVELTWDNHYNFDQNTFMKAFLYQLPTMVALGIDVTDKFLNFCTFNLGEEDERESFFQDIKEKISTLDYPINPSLEDSLSIDELLKFYSRRDNKDDLEEADFYSKVREQLFSEDNNLKDLESEKQRNYITGLFEILFFIKNEDSISPTAQSYRLNLSGFYEWASKRAQELSQQGTEEESERDPQVERKKDSQEDQDGVLKGKSDDGPDKKISDVLEKGEETEKQQEVDDQDQSAGQKSEEEPESVQGEDDKEQSEAEKPDTKTPPEDETKAETQKKREQQTEKQSDDSTETVADILEDEEFDSSSEVSKEDIQDEPGGKESDSTEEEVDSESDTPKEKDQQKDETAQENKQASSELKQAKQNVKKHQDMSIEEIKEEVEDQFGKLEDLEPENIEAFKRVLNSVARQQDREDEVQDWFYFDSDSGRFKWNSDYFNN